MAIIEISSHIVWHTPIHDVDYILLNKSLNVLELPYTPFIIKAAGKVPIWWHYFSWTVYWWLVWLIIWLACVQLTFFQLIIKAICVWLIIKAICVQLICSSSQLSNEYPVL